MLVAGQAVLMLAERELGVTRARLADPALRPEERKRLAATVARIEARIRLLRSQLAAGAPEALRPAAIAPGPSTRDLSYRFYERPDAMALVQRALTTPRAELEAEYERLSERLRSVGFQHSRLGDAERATLYAVRTARELRELPEGGERGLQRALEVFRAGPETPETAFKVRVINMELRRRAGTLAPTAEHNWTATVIGAAGGYLVAKGKGAVLGGVVGYLVGRR